MHQQQVAFGTRAVAAWRQCVDDRRDFGLCQSQAAQSQLTGAVIDGARRACGRQAGSQRAQHGFEIGGCDLARALLQGRDFACHLHRRVQHQLNRWEGLRQQGLDRGAFGFQRAALPERPGVEARQLDQHQQGDAPACGPPLRCVAQQLEHRGKFFPGAGTAADGQVELCQFPWRGSRLQPALCVLHHGYALANGLIGCFRHGRLGSDHCRVDGCTAQQCQSGAAQWQRYHAHRIASRQQCVVALACDEYQHGGVRRLRRELGDNPCHASAGCFERLDRRAQPDAVAGRNPGRRAGPGIGGNGKVQRLGLIEQLVFQQPVEHGA